jgi:hypothetical protein
MPSSSSATNPAPSTVSGFQAIPNVASEVQSYSISRPSGQRTALSALQVVPRAQLVPNASGNSSGPISPTTVSNSATTTASTRSSSAPASLPRLRRRSSLCNEIKEEDIELPMVKEEDEENFYIFEDPNGARSEFIMPSSDEGVRDSDLERASESGDPQEILDFFEDDFSIVGSRRSSETPVPFSRTTTRDERTAQLLRGMLSPELRSSPSTGTTRNNENQAPHPSTPSRHRPVYQTIRRQYSNVRRSASPRSPSRYSTTSMAPHRTPTPAPRPRLPRLPRPAEAPTQPPAPTEPPMPNLELQSSEMGALGAYTLLEHYPSDNPDKYVGNHRARVTSGVFGHIGRLANDNGGAIKPGMCKERLRFPNNSSDEAYIAWQAFEIEIKTSLESLGIESVRDTALNGDRNDIPEGVWMGLLNSLIDCAEELYLLSSDILEALREVHWSQLRRFYWHALDELVMSYVQTAQKRARRLMKFLETRRREQGPPPAVPVNRRRLRKIHARAAISSVFSQHP